MQRRFFLQNSADPSRFVDFPPTVTSISYPPPATFPFIAHVLYINFVNKFVRPLKHLGFFLKDFKNTITIPFWVNFSNVFHGGFIHRVGRVTAFFRENGWQEMDPQHPAAGGLRLLLFVFGRFGHPKFMKIFQGFNI